MKCVAFNIMTNIFQMPLKEGVNSIFSPAEKVCFILLEKTFANEPLGFPSFTCNLNDGS